jgi:NitT/TauT family transport system substrate-binding protein
MNKSGILAVAFVAGLSAGIAAGSAVAQAPGPAKKVTFLTNYVFHGRHSPYFVGLEKGFYKEQGFDIQIAPASGSGFVVTAVESGKADYGMAEAGPVVQAVAKGAKVKGFMVYMDASTSGLASFEPYKTPEELKGKKIAASQSDSARVILPIILATKKLDPASVDWQTADPGVYISLLMSGQVDLFTASIDGDVPALERVASQRGKQVHFASFAEWGYDVFGYLLIATSETLEKNPDEARRFAEATKKAVLYSIDNPEETARIMLKHNPTLNYDTTLSQWRQSIKAIKTKYVDQQGYGAATDDRWAAAIEFIQRALKLESKLAPRDVYVPAVTTR